MGSNYMEEVFANFCPHGHITADNFKQIYSVCVKSNLHGKGIKQEIYLSWMCSF